MITSILCIILLTSGSYARNLPSSAKQDSQTGFTNVPTRPNTLPLQARRMRSLGVDRTLPRLYLNVSTPLRVDSPNTALGRAVLPGSSQRIHSPNTALGRAVLPGPSQRIDAPLLRQANVRVLEARDQERNVPDENISTPPER